MLILLYIRSWRAKRGKSTSKCTSGNIRATTSNIRYPNPHISVRASASNRSKSRQRSESIEPRGQEEASSSKEVKPIPGDEQMDNLVAAASIGDIVSLKALLKAKVNANGKAKGVSALYAATSNSHSGAVKLLTRYGALPDFASSPDPAAMHRSYQSLLSQPASRK